MADDVPLVSGEAVFGAGDTAFSEATAYVRLDEVSRADAAARRVAEQVIRHVSCQPGQPGRLVFALHGPAPEAHLRYTVSAHLDVDGDGAVSRGDYITMESYPVLTHGHPHTVSLRLRKVG